MDLGIAGRRALVLGGSSGLGAASAAALAGEGVRVTAASRSLDRLAQAAAVLPPEVAARITPNQVDLSDPRSIEALVAACGTHGIDILVNNSGGPRPGTTQEQTTDSWQDAFASMASPLFRITAGLLPHMQRQRWGRIITIGSSGIEQPIQTLAVSNAIRAAVAGWSKSLANEVAADGVTVNMVLPGRIDTDRVRSLDALRAEKSGKSIPDTRLASVRDIPAGRYGEPMEFGAVVAFVASQLAGYVTGSMLRVDGGSIRSL